MQGRVPDPFELVDGLNRRGRERDERERARHHGGRSVGPCAVRMWSSRLRCADGSRRPSDDGIAGKGKARRFEKRPLYPPNPRQRTKPRQTNSKAPSPHDGPRATPSHLATHCADAFQMRGPNGKDGRGTCTGSAWPERQLQQPSSGSKCRRQSHLLRHGTRTSAARPRDRSAR